MVLVLLLSMFLGLVSFVPLRTAVEIGADEGFELAKATLCLHGHRLYTEIWNDQPPLDTVLLAQVLKQATPSVLGPRLMTVGFALVLLTGVFLAALRVHGLAVATLATACVIVSPGFLELGCSAMLEVPALAPVVFALALLLARPAGGHGTRFLAGLVFAVGLQIKFIGAMYLPLAGWILWLGRAEADPAARGTDGRRRLRPPAGFLGASGRFVGGLVLGFAAIGAWVDDGSFLLQLRQSLGSHFAPARTLAYGSPSDHPFEWAVLLRNWDATVPALVGLGLLLRKRNARTAVPGIWLGLTLLVFGIHRPWWNYYYVHQAVPLGWCAALGLRAAWSWARRTRRSRRGELLGAGGVALAAWAGARVWLQLADIRALPRTYATPVLAEMARFRPAPEFLFTDEPVYSFHAGIPLPPKLGVVPLKRFWSGELTFEGIAAELARVRPGLILLRNDSRDVPCAALLQSDYRLVYYDDAHRLYALRGLDPTGR